MYSGSRWFAGATGAGRDGLEVLGGIDQGLAGCAQDNLAVNLLPG
jgi:hypothetical protein